MCFYYNYQFIFNCIFYLTKLISNERSKKKKRELNFGLDNGSIHVYLVSGNDQQPTGINAVCEKQTDNQTLPP